MCFRKETLGIVGRATRESLLEVGQRCRAVAG
jgi:hypothetical protein